MRVGIIGGGVSGLAAARHFLQCGIACTVFDTGKRGVGGRCSSRTKTQFPGAVDHAAQFVESSGRSDAFDAFIQDCVSSGVLRPWDGKFVGSETEGLGALPDFMAEGVEVRQDRWVAPNGGVFKKPDGTWSADKEQFDAVVIALGVAMLFAQEWRASPATLGEVLMGAGLTVCGILSASAANIIQATEGAKRQPLLTLLAWSMTVGVVLNAGFALATQGPPQFDDRPAYALGILYLGLLGSVVTFPLYYGLVRKVGAGTAAYSSVIVPIVAMILSTLFEGYVWGPLPAAGAAITLTGMVVAMRGRTAAPPRRATCGGSRRARSCGTSSRRRRT